MKDWLNLSLSDISEKMVVDRYRSLLESGVGKANNFKRTLSVVFTHALGAPYYRDEQGNSLITRNPIKCLSHMDILEESDPRKNTISGKDLEAWFDAVKALENKKISDYLQLLILTGLRKSEGERLIWEDISLDTKRFTVRDTKNGTDHTLPMTQPIREIFLRRQTERDGIFVFPCERRSKSGHITDVSRYRTLVKEASGVDFDLHDLRRTFASAAANIKMPPYIVKALLNHRSKADVTQQHYLEFELETLEAALSKIDTYILMTAHHLL